MPEQGKGRASPLFPSMAWPRLLGRRRILGRGGGALRRSVLLRTLVAGAAAAGAGASVPFAFGGLALTRGFGRRGRGFDRGFLDGDRRADRVGQEGRQTGGLLRLLAATLGARPVPACLGAVLPRGLGGALRPLLASAESLGSGLRASGLRARPAIRAVVPLAPVR